MGLYCKWLMVGVVCMAVSCQADDIFNYTVTANNTTNDVLNASVVLLVPLVNGNTTSKCREDSGVGQDRDNCSGVHTQRILSSPVGCPEGYAADAQGMCRELWNSSSASGARPAASLLLYLPQLLLQCYLTVAWGRG